MHFAKLIRYFNTHLIRKDAKEERREAKRKADSTEGECFSISTLSVFTVLQS